MKKFAEQQLSKFLKDHLSEVFYGFAIDDGLLCLNSLSEFEKTLKKYQQNNEIYKNPNEIEELKFNTGDWSYQGFANLNNSPGYNARLYNKFYNLGFFGGSEQELQSTAYYKAMAKLMHSIEQTETFKRMPKTVDFKTFVVYGND
jgi:hypothetical protein